MLSSIGERVKQWGLANHMWLNFLGFMGSPYVLEVAHVFFISCERNIDHVVSRGKV